jgi:hypothetical protein
MRQVVLAVFSRACADAQTCHFKLLNALARNMAVQDRDKAQQLHHDLMQSGMDRILVVSSFLRIISTIAHARPCAKRQRHTTPRCTSSWRDTSSSYAPTRPTGVCHI